MERLIPAQQWISSGWRPSQPREKASNCSIWSRAGGAVPAAGTAPPLRQHMDQLLEFSRTWDASRPMVIHCWAGISRSMASAYAILCDRIGTGREIQIARAMRRRAPHAQPNRLLVRHADEALERDGKMILALNSMGPPLVMEEGIATAFPLVDL